MHILLVSLRMDTECLCEGLAWNMAKGKQAPPASPPACFSGFGHSHSLGLHFPSKREMTSCPHSLLPGCFQHLASSSHFPRLCRITLGAGGVGGTRDDCGTNPDVQISIPKSVFLPQEFCMGKDPRPGLLKLANHLSGALTSGPWAPSKPLKAHWAGRLTAMAAQQMFFV
jgi:hypothetical protein